MLKELKEAKTMGYGQVASVVSVFPSKMTILKLDDPVAFDPETNALNVPII